MATKTYVCTRNPSHRIGSQVKFADGWFTTDNGFIQRIIETNAWYGSHIHCVPTEFAASPSMVVEEEDVDLGTDDVVPEPPMTAGDTLVYEPPTEPQPVPVDQAPGEAPWLAHQPEPVAKAGAWNEVTATDVSRMKVAEARALATELGIDHENLSSTAVKREIRIKLGI